MQHELPLCRTSDPVTSQRAGEALAPSISALQFRVLDAFRRYGCMSARQCERLGEFSDLGFSTVRKRVTELHRMGRLEAVGVERESGKVPCRTYRFSRRD